MDYHFQQDCHRWQKLLPYFVPLYDAIIERSIAVKHWHADETSWKVFESIEGKKNHNWDFKQYC